MCSLLTLPLGILLCLQCSTASPLNYKDRPYKFVEIVANCLDNEDCVFFYWHMGKTGGTTVYWYFAKVLSESNAHSLCCWENAMQKFEKNMQELCASKFSSYQVRGDDMRMIVESCVKLRPSLSAVVLFTYRDPISTFVSGVNQWCNIGFNTMSAEFKRVCHRCVYASDTREFFEKKVTWSNNLYSSQSYITEMVKSNVQVLLLDVIDLSGFLELQSKRGGFHTTASRMNSGKTNICDYGITSEIIKKLSPSVDVYRNLSLGLY